MGGPVQHNCCLPIGPDDDDYDGRVKIFFTFVLCFRKLNFTCK